jgi:hypothetical protein
MDLLDGKLPNESIVINNLNALPSGNGKADIDINGTYASAIIRAKSPDIGTM